MVRFIKRMTGSEVTKRLLGYTMLLITCITISTVVESIIFQDLSPLLTLIDKSYEFGMIVAGFYIWKAKNENLHKYKCDDKIGEN